MPSSNICWGIEIGAGSIKGLKLEAAGDGVRVLDFANIPHKSSLSTPGLDQNDALRVGLGAFASHRIMRAIPAFRRATPDWASWTHADFPMGLALAGTLIFYLLAALRPFF